MFLLSVIPLPYAAKSPCSIISSFFQPMVHLQGKYFVLHQSGCDWVVRALTTGAEGFGFKTQLVHCSNRSIQGSTPFYFGANQRYRTWKSKLKCKLIIVAYAANLSSAKGGRKCLSLLSMTPHNLWSSRTKISPNRESLPQPRPGRTPLTMPTKTSPNHAQEGLPPTTPRKDSPNHTQTMAEKRNNDC